MVFTQSGLFRSSRSSEATSKPPESSVQCACELLSFLQPGLVDLRALEPIWRRLRHLRGLEKAGKRWPFDSFDS